MMKYTLSRPLDLLSSIIYKMLLLLPFSFFGSFFLLIIHKFVWINLTIGSGALCFRQGFYTYAMMQSAAVFSLSGHITIRVNYPLLRTWTDGAKKVRFLTNLKLIKWTTLQNSLSVLMYQNLILMYR